MRIAALDRLAEGSGLHIGQSLAEARALVPALDAREIDRERLEHGFADFADWHSNASPIVAVLPDETAFGDLCLDITGVAHLFGGEQPMLEKLVDRLAASGFEGMGAIAPTIGAAWALAHFAPGSIVSDDPALALHHLPVRALRLDEATASGLRQLGLKQIGQLYGRDRKSLATRFGAALVRRLDQALGLADEPLAPRVPVAERFAERNFAEPIGLIDDVLMTADDLAVRLAHRLEAEGLGAQSFHLMLYRVDHQVIRLSVNAARPTRDAGHIARLFRNRAERLAGEYDAGFGIDLIRLGASSVSPLASLQAGALGTVDGAADIDRLADRMASRLGPFAVLRSRLLDTHMPERAVRLEPVVAPSPEVEAEPPPHPRPLRLLPEPEPVAVMAEIPDGPPAGMVWRRVRYRFAKGSGPERIEAEWWRTGRQLALLRPPPKEPPAKPDRDGRRPVAPPLYVPRLATFDPAGMARDYYIVEDEAGRRFWLFRLGLYGGETAPRWFLHGIFP